MVVTGYTNTVSYHRKHIFTLRDAYQIKHMLLRLLIYSIPFLLVVVFELADPNTDKQFDGFLDGIQWILSGTRAQGSYYYPVIIQTLFVFPLIYFGVTQYKNHIILKCFTVAIIIEILSWAYGLNEETYRLLMFRYMFQICAGVYAYKNVIPRTTSILLTAVGGIHIPNSICRLSTCTI